MPRKPRRYVEGAYHVASHGSDQRRLFIDDDDRNAFLDHLSLTCTMLGIEIVSYVLMTTHYHALIWTPDDRIARGLQQVHGGYSLKHNQRHGHSAHLFRAHCLARRITDDTDLLTVAAYIASNPVAAGIVVHPDDWPWSSAAAHSGRARPRIPLVESHLRAAFGDSSTWRRRFARLVDANPTPMPPPGIEPGHAV